MNPDDARYYAQRSLVYLFADRMDLAQADEEMCEDLRNRGFASVGTTLGEPTSTWLTHRPKAFIRSKLWSDEYRIDRGELPSFAEILRDHSGLNYDLEEYQKGLDIRLVTTLH